MTRNRPARLPVLNAFSLFIAILTLLVAFPAPAQDAGRPSEKVPAAPVPTAQLSIRDNYGKLPLRFEANHGQVDARVKFLSRTSGYSLFLTGDEAVLALRGHKSNTNNTKTASTADWAQPDMAAGKAGGVLRLKLRNANPAANVTGLDQQAGTSNYFTGNDPAKWRSNVPTYAKVKYEEIYSGIDLLYYGNQRQVEFDFFVASGADPHRIQFDVRGARTIRRDANGDLVLTMEESEIRWHKPVVYQEKDGARQEIAAHYAITDRNRVGFEVAKYDTSRPLHIDPLIYSTYLGGSLSEYATGIAVDSAGYAYVTGYTDSTDFPTVNALQPARSAGGYDVFVAKVNPTGSALVYSTYLGGSADDRGFGIATDSAGNAYVTGQTSSNDFPTKDPIQAANAAYSSIFVAKINPTGSALLYSTYLGGSVGQNSFGIAVDSAGNAYLTGWTTSPDFPTKNPLQLTYAGNGDAFVAKINPTGSALVYSTYLGGTGNDIARSIAVDSEGQAYIGGATESIDFPTRNPLQLTYSGAGDAFVAKVNSAGSALVYSTYLGGTGHDYLYGIAADRTGNAYITGNTFSNDFPTNDPMQPAKDGNSDIFVTKINPTGSALLYSTYLGGSAGEDGLGIAVDSAGKVHIAGLTSSEDFPTTPGAFQTICDDGFPTRCASWADAFVTTLDASGSALVYSTFLGGGRGSLASAIAVDSAGNSYVTGSTLSYNFPTKYPLQATRTGYVGNPDAFITKIDERAGITATLSSAPNPSTYGQAVTFTAILGSNLLKPPDGETVLFEKGTVVLGTGILSGCSASFTTSSLPVGKYVVDAVYSGDSKFAGNNTKAVTQVVKAYPTSTTMVSSLNPSIYGQTVTWTALVTSSGPITPTGIVRFKWNGYQIGSATLNSAGVATLTKWNLNADLYPLTAVYVGDMTNQGSASAMVNQVVTQATSTAALTSSQNPSAQGQATTFTARISSPAIIPTGPVTFTSGTTVLGTAQLGNGKATLTISSLALGSTRVTATYYGNSNIAKSSAWLTQTVK